MWGVGVWAEGGEGLGEVGKKPPGLTAGRGQSAMGQRTRGAGSWEPGREQQENGKQWGGRGRRRRERRGQAAQQ